MERTRCTFCRNPIRPHQAAAGPAAAYHEDCWSAAQATPTPRQQQDDYSRRIAAEGLSGVLAPYLSVFPPEQHSFTAPLEPITQREKTKAAAQVTPQPSVAPDPTAPVAAPVPAPVSAPVAPQVPTASAGAAETVPRRPEPNFVIVGRG